MSTYEPIIGLEIHVQLKTKTKMFCGCPTHDSAVAPNTHVCPICLGHPGTLPVPNHQAIHFGVRMGLALGCEIADHSKFDRKNYFYPDLPKAYQISQFDLPVAGRGEVEILVPGAERETVKIGITRAHLEEDAAKNVHGDDGSTYVDFNRGGTPLIEIVTEPDFRTAREAKIFLQELRLIARYLGISSADMEKGHMRCDANVSLRPYDKDGNPTAPLHAKTEVKNLNSFRHVERAIEHELQRQKKLWDAGTPPNEGTTRGWDDAKGITVDQRSKEDAADYRYFPEPDIPPLALAEVAEVERARLPELPVARRARFEREYALKPSDARHMCDDVALADFTEHAFSELGVWLETLEDEAQMEAAKKKLGKLVASWLLSRLGGLLSEQGQDIATMKITPENFAEFITLIATRKLNNAGGLKVLSAMMETGADPSHIMEDQQLGQMEDAGALAQIVTDVIESHPDEVARYRAGEEKLITFFIGMVMKASQGTADAALTRNMLLVELKAE